MVSATLTSVAPAHAPSAPAPAAGPAAAQEHGLASFARQLTQAREPHEASPEGSAQAARPSSQETHQAAGDPAQATGQPASQAAAASGRAPGSDKSAKTDKAAKDEKSERGAKAGKAAKEDKDGDAAASAAQPNATPADAQPESPDLASLLPGWHPGTQAAAPADGARDGAAADEEPGAAGAARGAGRKLGRTLAASAEGPGAGRFTSALEAHHGAAARSGAAAGQAGHAGDKDSDFQSALKDAGAGPAADALAGAGLAGAAQALREESRPAAVAADPSAAAMAQASPASPSNSPVHVAATSTAPFEAQLSAPPGSADFAPALGVQLTLMAREGVQEARLHLNPADMGPIAVQIAVEGTQAQVHFQADVASTRHALESSLPDLAAALREGGFTLTGGGVSGQRQDGSGQAPGREQAGGRQGGVGGVDSAGQASAPRAVRTQGVVDLYA